MPAENHRSIVHLDADAFFASVEQAADPRLRGKPVAVGGEKRGVIASASYEARKFGIYTPMPTAMARRLCPKLILLPGDFEKYELFSRLMFAYAYDFTPDVEIGSIDEGYFDLTGVRKPAIGIAQTIRDAIRQSLKLSVSEGVASNKLVSQIASKLNKPCALETVPTGKEAEYLAPLANKWLPGVGPKTARQLNAAGLSKIGQIASTPAELLGLLVGNQAGEIKRFSQGIDERPIIPVQAPAKSYSEQETFPADTTDEAFLEATLCRMADRLMAKVRLDNKSIRTVTVKIRYNDMDEAQVSESLAEPTDIEGDIYPITSSLLYKAWQRRVSLRLVSLKLSKVYEGRYFTILALDSAARQQDARGRLTGAIDYLRQKYGSGILLRGHDFILREKTASPEEVQAPETALRESAPPYGLIAASRQRLANSIALKAAEPEQANRCSPAPELHFRVEAVVPPGAEAGAKKFKVTAAFRRSTLFDIPLNVHSYYSFLDSTLSIEAIIDFAKRNHFPAIALTDRNNLHGAVEFGRAAAEAGIKAIIGAEISWTGASAPRAGDVPVTRFPPEMPRNDFCVYVQNQRGYHNLCRILNRLSRPDGSDCEYGFRAEDLLKNTEGLIAVGPDPALARFFPDQFYLNITDPEALKRRSTPLPCVGSFPVHYELPSDRWKYDIVQSIRTLTLLKQQHRNKREGGDYHFRNPGELRRLYETHPELLANSAELAERCEFSFKLDKPQFPGYSPPDGSTPAEYLHRLAMDGLRRRYPKEYEKRKAQVEEELAIILDVGYEEYFLVMWDILHECKTRGIEWITRGSAADSLVCFCLGISGVCPIRFDLYFRRFLNKDRMALNKLPDIDVDFPHDRKDDVIDLVFEKYSASNAAIVGGFSTFQARSAFAETAKVLGVSEFQVRRITERFPHYSRTGELAAAIAGTQECRDLPLTEEPYATALRMGQFLDGFPRYAKMHPCGLVLSRQPIDEISPCFTSAKGYPTTHFDMDSVEAVGLVKMDILAQGGLAVMRDVKGMVSKGVVQRPCCNVVTELSNRGADPIDLESLAPWQDEEVWELIGGGGARAVHHIESPAMISLCKMCNVRDIDTLIAIVSVIRPGAANESKKMEFARRYQGLSPVHYPHASLESCLRSTYGLVVYEEHILQICEAFAGLAPGRADILRRALAKEKTRVIEEIRLEFMKCARKRGRTEREIEEVWGLVAGFSGYAFCKAHSTAYGVEAYQSAWLKRYYPAEFMAGVLTNGKGFYHPLVYVLECHRLGIGLLPPGINYPGPAFTVTDGKIRVPVLQLKGLTRRTSETLLKERERGWFESITDFFFRVRPSPEEMDILIQAGAFDELGQNRTAQYWQFKSLCRNVEIPRSGGTASQLWLLPPGNLDRLPEIALTEPDRLARLRAEEELLGYPVTGHPLELFPDIAWETYCPINRLSNYIGQQVVTCGLVIEQRLFHQITGEPMKFLTIADRTGIIETELFARSYQSYGLNTVRYRVLEITAIVEPFENNRGHSLRVLRAGKPRTHQDITGSAAGVRTK